MIAGEAEGSAVGGRAIGAPPDCHQRYRTLAEPLDFGAFGPRKSKVYAFPQFLLASSLPTTKSRVENLTICAWALIFLVALFRPPCCSKACARNGSTNMYCAARLSLPPQLSMRLQVSEEKQLQASLAAFLAHLTIFESLSTGYLTL